MEKTRYKKRSPLWYQIFDKVKEIPRENVSDEAVDHSSLTTTLENMFVDEMCKFKAWYDKLSPVEKCTVWSEDGGMKGLFVLPNIEIVKKYINQKK
jgi:hypothetical protein